MTKKHYVAIAAIINDRLTEIDKQLDLPHDNEVVERFIGARCDAEVLARSLASYFQTDNKDFQRERFLVACGVRK